MYYIYIIYRYLYNFIQYIEPLQIFPMTTSHPFPQNGHKTMEQPVLGYGYGYGSVGLHRVPGTDPPDLSVWIPAHPAAA